MQFTERIWPKIQPLWDSYMTHPLSRAWGTARSPWKSLNIGWPRIMFIWLNMRGCLQSARQRRQAWRL